MCTHAVHSGSLVFQLGVDLTGSNVRGVLRADLGEGLVAATQSSQHVHCSEHAGVCVEEVLEVVVSGVLATENAVLLSHNSLDEGVAHAGLHCAAAQLLNQLRNSLRGDQVVDDDGLFVTLCLRTSNLALSNQSGHSGRSDGLTLLVDDEATVSVAVECQTNVSTVLNNSLLQVNQVSRLQRVSRVVREGAVQLEVQGNDFQGQARQDGVAQNSGSGHTTHAVTSVNNNLQGADGRQINQLAQVLCVRLENVLLRNGADLLNRRNLARIQVLLSQIANIEQTGLGRQRNSASLSHLHAVVLCGVVASGEGNTGSVLNATCEVQNVSGDQADLLNICTASGCTLGECIHEFGGGGAHVATDQDGLALQAQNVYESRASSANSLCGNGLADDATHVVRFE